jgi:hypothetical protein
VSGCVPLPHRAIDASYVDPDTMDFEGQDFIMPADPQPKPEKVGGDCMSLCWRGVRSVGVYGQAGDGVGVGGVSQCSVITDSAARTHTGVPFTASLVLFCCCSPKGSPRSCSPRSLVCSGLHLNMHHIRVCMCAVE